MYEVQYSVTIEILSVTVINCVCEEAERGEKRSKKSVRAAGIGPGTANAQSKRTADSQMEYRAAVDDGALEEQAARQALPIRRQGDQMLGNGARKTGGSEWSRERRSGRQTRSERKGGQ